MKTTTGMVKLMVEVRRNDRRPWFPDDRVEAMLGELPFVEEIWDGGAQYPAVIVRADSLADLAARLPEYEATILAVAERRAWPVRFHPGSTWQTILGGRTEAGLRRYREVRELALGF